MKRFASLAVALTMLLSLCVVSASAVDNDINGTEKVVTVEGYAFVITEQEDENHIISRTYVKSESKARSIVSPNETKALLKALGMREERIEKLSTATIQDFSDSNQIVITSSYTKYNEVSKELTYLTEQTAIEEATAVKEEQETYHLRMANGGGPETRDYKPNESDIPGEFEDTYMYMTHAAAYKGNGSYLFTTDAQWLTMPYFRGDDSIGSCAMDCTVTPNTASGAYSYGVRYLEHTGETYYDTSEGAITDIRTKSVNGWHGVAGIFDMPNNVYDEHGTSRHYENFDAYLEYRGHITSPDETRWFNSVGTYDHSVLTLDVSPSINIDFNGDVSASIGLSVDRETDTRCAEIEVQYIPD